ncbi:MAG: PAQR family membrane homeostasis protein TrhA [Candidatus Cyclobacteriaceae bacterium M3_2C_046]
MKKEFLNGYNPEEKWNILTHGIAMLLSMAGLIVLVNRALDYAHFKFMFSALVFGLSLIILYASSFLYHLYIHSSSQRLLQIIDHAAIFILIAGTYTPFTLIILDRNTGLIIFWLVWSIAAAGIIYKLFFTGKYRLLSSLLYLGMGWLIIFKVQELWQQLPLAGNILIYTGGFFYSFGVIFYQWDRLPYNHAIWHLFVVAGSFSHFLAVIYFVI